MYYELASDVLTCNKPVKVWDTIGEDKILKGEYKVLAGRMYAALIRVFCMNGMTDRREF